MSRSNIAVVPLLVLAPFACVDEGGLEESSSVSSYALPTPEALVDRAKSFELPTKRIGPPGDPAPSPHRWFRQDPLLGRVHHRA